MSIPKGSVRKKSFAATTWQSLVSFSRDNRFFRKGDVVLCGLSGGPDSVCLLHFLKELSRIKGFSLRAVHVNHQLRGGDSTADEKFSKKLCAEIAVPIDVYRVNVKSLAGRGGYSLEHAARKARYGAFERAAKKRGAAVVAVAHHLDDNVETMLLGLLRGASLKSLRGIASKRPLSPGVSVVRPLLCITRSEVMDYIAEHGLAYRTDKSNESEDFTRNWVRLTLLPLLESKQPRFRQHMLALSRELLAVDSGKK